MSRRTIPSRLPGHEVVVGYDVPMGTYFAQVHRLQPDDDQRDPLVFWIGGDFGTDAAPRHLPPGDRFAMVQRPEDLVTPLAPYAELTGGHAAQLRADRAEVLDRGPSPLQRQLMELAKRNGPR